MYSMITVFIWWVLLNGGWKVRGGDGHQVVWNGGGYDHQVVWIWGGDGKF